MGGRETVLLTMTTTPESGSPLLKVDEAAALLRCKSCTVRALIKRGSLPFVPVGRLVFLRRSAVLEWIERHETRKKLATLQPHAAVKR
jgi:excisionase family DNA binding protein